MTKVEVRMMEQRRRGWGCGERKAEDHEITVVLTGLRERARDQFERGGADEAVALQVEALAVMEEAAFGEFADDREQHRRVARPPGRIAAPQQGIAGGVVEAVEFGAEQGDVGREVAGSDGDE